MTRSRSVENAPHVQAEIRFSADGDFFYNRHVKLNLKLVQVQFKIKVSCALLLTTEVGVMALYAHSPNECSSLRKKEQKALVA